MMTEQAPRQPSPGPAPSRIALRAFRSLSRAMFLGFLRDRTALTFTILIPVLFLVLLGSIYKSSGTPKITVLEVGTGQHARPGPGGQPPPAW